MSHLKSPTVVPVTNISMKVRVITRARKNIAFDSSALALVLYAANTNEHHADTVGAN